MHSIADKNETAPVVNALVRIPSRTKTISATFAPKAEAEDMPSVDGDASGLFNADWMTIPDRAMLMPTKKPPMILGRRMSKTILACFSIPRPARAFRLSPTVIPEEPIFSDNAAVADNKTISSTINDIFRERYFRYCTCNSVSAIFICLHLPA